MSVQCVKIELLTGDSSLALNILLAQHKFVPKELVTWMTQGNVDSVGAGTLKLLINSLPSDDEVSSQTFSSSFDSIALLVLGSWFFGSVLLNDVMQFF